jgi:iron complex outermembrane receptor protein
MRLVVRPLKKIQFCSRPRTAKILTAPIEKLSGQASIHSVFRGLKFEPDAGIGQKGTFFKGLVVTIILCVVLSANCATMAMENDDNYFELDPVVVTGSRIPHRLSNTAKSISIITKEEINSMPAADIADILKLANGVDVRRRGPYGVQADIGIRGSSYEQTLILVDGISVNDPQTGHHNMNLPVNLDDIERIEILKGPAATVYGPNAMGGVVNIITRDPETNALSGHMNLGQYGYYDIGTQGAWVSNKITNRISAGRRRSSGHIEEKDTDFDVKTVNYKSSLKTGSNQYHLGLGYTEKDFGAYKFYSDVYPDQREKTDTLLLYGSADLHVKDIKIVPKIHWRYNDDEFKIKVNNIWNVNQHRTDTLGLQVDSRVSSGLGETSMGVQAVLEDLTSSNMGDRNRRRQALFAEHKFNPLDNLTIDLGASGIHYSDWGWKLCPGGGLNVALTDELNGFISLERSIRVPTFTELYYVSPANQGNPNLEPEKAWTYETGMRLNIKHLKAEVSLFFRDAKDVIDYSRSPGDTVWLARNIAEISTTGAETALSYHPESLFGTKMLSSLRLAYTHLEMDRDAEGLESKYALDHLRHQLHGSVVIDWSSRLQHTINARYGKRMAGDDFVVVDSRLTYTFSKYQVFLEATNLFDGEYIESGFAPMPGSWVIGGVKLNWN